MDVLRATGGSEDSLTSWSLLTDSDLNDISSPARAGTSYKRPNSHADLAKSYFSTVSSPTTSTTPGAGGRFGGTGAGSRGLAGVAEEGSYTWNYPSNSYLSLEAGGYPNGYPFPGGNRRRVDLAGAGVEFATAPKQKKLNSRPFARMDPYAAAWGMEGGILCFARMDPYAAAWGKEGGIVCWRERSYHFVRVVVQTIA